MPPPLYAARCGPARLTPEAPSALLPVAVGAMNIHDVLDRQTSDVVRRQTDVRRTSSLNVSALSGRRHNKLQNLQSTTLSKNRDSSTCALSLQGTVAGRWQLPCTWLSTATTSTDVRLSAGWKTSSVNPAYVHSFVTQIYGCLNQSEVRVEVEDE